MADIGAFEPAEWRDLWALRTHPEVARWLGGTPFDPPDQRRFGFEDVPQESVHVLCARAEKRVVAYVQLVPFVHARARHVARLHLAVHPDHQRQGLGRELLHRALQTADRWLNALRVELDVFAENTAAIALFESAGFVIEARKAADMLLDGRPAAGLHMARLRPDFAPPAAVTPPPSWPARRDLDGEVRLRVAVPEDAVAFAALMRDEGTVWGTMQLPTTGSGFWKQRLSAPEPQRWLLIFAEVGGRLAGQVGLSPPIQPRRRHLSHLGIAVHRDFQGMGLGKQLMVAGLDYADRWLGLQRVDLEVYPDNLRARRLYEQHGFVEEGLRRCAVFRDGTYVDSLMMSRVRA